MMQNTFLYLVTVLIWGSTWLAIKFQLGVVPPELSVAYRFLLASVLLFGFIRVRRLPVRFPLRAHTFIAVQGLFLFCLNYILVYLAEVHVASGLAAVLFSAVVFFNVMFGTLFLKSPIRQRVLLGSVVGVVGLVFIFWSEFSGLDLNSTKALGLTLAVSGAASASLGNIVSARNQRDNLPVIQTNAYGMLYGAGAMFLFAALRGTGISIDSSFSYLGSLLYLAVFGSAVAFGSYLTLLGRIGADRAGYVFVLFPIIALVLSALFEGLALNTQQLAGVALVLLGNAIVLRAWPSRSAGTEGNL